MKRKLLYQLMVVATIAVTTIAAFAQYPPPPACYQNADQTICAQSPASGSYLVPSGSPCAGQTVTLTVNGTFFGPGVVNASPGNQGTTTNPSAPCCFMGTYVCHGMGELVYVCLPSTSQDFNSAGC